VVRNPECKARRAAVLAALRSDAGQPAEGVRPQQQQQQRQQQRQERAGGTGSLLRPLRAWLSWALGATAQRPL
jgi:hypothetical protein